MMEAAAKKGRPQEELEKKLHRGIRSRVRYTGRGTRVPLHVPPQARQNRPKRADGTKITAGEWDIWWSKQVETGEYKVGVTADMGTGEAREMTRMQHESAQSSHEAYVHQWIKARGKEGKQGAPHLTPGLLEALIRSRASRGTRRAAVYAATLAASARWGWRIQHSGMGNGGQRISATAWMRGIAVEAVKAGWYTEAQMDNVIAEAQVTTPERRNVAIVLGMGYGGTSEGLRTAGMRVVDLDSEAIVRTGEKEGALAPDVMAMFSDAGEDLVPYVARRSCTPIGEVAMVSASPSCLDTSVANGLGKTKGCGRGIAGGKDTPREDTHEFYAVMRGLKKWASEAQERGRKVAWMIEQPRDGKRKDDPVVVAEIGEGITLNGCAYGLLHKKPYRIWTNIPWTPKDSKAVCEFCRAGIGEHLQQVCPRAGSTRKRPTLEGYNSAAAKNRIPPPLITHWAQAAAQAIGLTLEPHTE